MTVRRMLLACGAAATLLAAGFLFQPAPGIEERAPDSGAVGSGGGGQPNPGPEPTAANGAPAPLAAAALSSPAPEPEPAVALDPPSLETLRAEAGANPHGTPPSLLAFGRRMAARMEAVTALAPDAAPRRAFVAELVDCATSADSARFPVQVQTVCAANAERLDPGSRARDRASPQVKQILDAIDVFAG